MNILCFCEISISANILLRNRDDCYIVLNYGQLKVNKKLSSSGLTIAHYLRNINFDLKCSYHYESVWSIARFEPYYLFTRSKTLQSMKFQTLLITYIRIWWCYLQLPYQTATSQTVPLIFIILNHPRFLNCWVFCGDVLPF